MTDNHFLEQVETGALTQRYWERDHDGLLEDYWRITRVKIAQTFHYTMLQQSIN